MHSQRWSAVPPPCTTAVITASWSGTSSASASRAPAAGHCCTVAAVTVASVLTSAPAQVPRPADSGQPKAAARVPGGGRHHNHGAAGQAGPLGLLSYWRPPYTLDDRAARDL